MMPTRRQLYQWLAEWREKLLIDPCWKIKFILKRKQGYKNVMETAIDLDVMEADIEVYPHNDLCPESYYNNIAHELGHLIVAPINEAHLDNEKIRMKWEESVVTHLERIFCGL